MTYLTFLMGVLERAPGNQSSCEAQTNHSLSIAPRSALLLAADSGCGIPRRTGYNGTERLGRAADAALFASLDLPLPQCPGRTSAGVSSGRKRVGVVFAGVGYRGRRIARGEGVSQGFVHTPLAPARLRVEAHGLAPPNLRLLR